MSDLADYVTADGVDVLCRFWRMAHRHPELFHHVCCRRDGRSVRGGTEDCFWEARAEFLEMRPQPEVTA